MESVFKTFIVTIVLLITLSVSAHRSEHQPNCKRAFKEVPGSVFNRIKSALYAPILSDRVRSNMKDLIGQLTAEEIKTFSDQDLYRIHRLGFLELFSFEQLSYFTEEQIKYQFVSNALIHLYRERFGPVFDTNILPQHIRRIFE